MKGSTCTWTEVITTACVAEDTKYAHSSLERGTHKGIFRIDQVVIRRTLYDLV
jgi:hypothetical protein